MTRFSRLTGAQVGGNRKNIQTPPLDFSTSKRVLIYECVQGIELTEDRLSFFPGLITSHRRHYAFLST